MRKSQLTENEIITTLKQDEAGRQVHAASGYRGTDIL